MGCEQTSDSITGLKDDLLATDSSSLQVDEGSHLLGPGMLGNEPVAGLMESGRNEQRSFTKEAVTWGEGLPVGRSPPHR